MRNIRNQRFGQGIPNNEIYCTTQIHFTTHSPRNVWINLEIQFFPIFLNDTVFSRPFSTETSDIQLFNGYFSLLLSHNYGLFNRPVSWLSESAIAIEHCKCVRAYVHDVDSSHHILHSVSFKKNECSSFYVLFRWLSMLLAFSHLIRCFDVVFNYLRTQHYI